ncbi:MAG: hypothetical protein KIT84_27475 [Labilithrix sp.]|nr:hypothetical protein [Labilithrix sp.]MCW5814799.1 hypothetical protein [Labilithrix sp.]
MNRTIVISSSVLLAAAIVAACKSNPPPVNVSVGAQDAGAPPDEAGVITAPPAEDAGGPVAPPFFTGEDAGGAAPAPALTEQAMDVAIDALLATASAKSAPKMSETGQPGRQTMKEGDHLVMMVTLEPNKCYTIIGTSLPGTVTQLDIKLYGPPFYNVEAGQSGANDKALPVLAPGAKALCPISPIALPYKLDAVATKGAGRVGVKVYSRAK